MRPISEDRGRAFPGGARRAPRCNARSEARIAVPGPPTGGPRGKALPAGPAGDVDRRRRRGSGGGAGSPDDTEVEHR